MKTITNVKGVKKLNKKQQEQITGGLRQHPPCGGPGNENQTSSGYCEPV